MLGDMLGSVPDWITAIVAMMATLYAVFEYRRQGHWKRQELEQQLLEALTKDSTLALACHALDWGMGKVVVPERYRPLVGGRDSVDLDPRAVFESMRPSITPDFKTNETLKLYRVCFDDFFSHLERIQQLAEADRIDLSSMRTMLDYWLWRIAVPMYCPAGQNRLSMFLDFVEAAGYRRVGQLLWYARDRIRTETDALRGTIDVPSWMDIERRLLALTT